MKWKGMTSRTVLTHQIHVHAYTPFKIQHGWNWRMRFLMQLPFPALCNASFSLEINLFRIYSSLNRWHYILIVDFHIVFGQNELTSNMYNPHKSSIVTSFWQFYVVWCSESDHLKSIRADRHARVVGWLAGWQRNCAVNDSGKSVWHRIIIDCLRNENIAVSISRCVCVYGYGWWWCRLKPSSSYRLSNNRQYHLREASRTIACMYHTTAVARLSIWIPLFCRRCFSGASFK